MTPTANTGERIGHYVIEGELGRGAMGSVYLARHEVLGRRAAVKVLLDALVQDQTLVQRFIQEAQIVNAIQHPNIIDVFEFHYSESPRRLAYIMEYVGAKPLHDVARHLSLLQAFSIGRQIASALAAVHAAGVVHRDLKPDNILVELTPRFENGPVAKLADFGIAKVRGPGRPNTDSGRVIGTPAYMAPEQIASGGVDGQADIYAFGTILYELITGTRLYAGDATQIMHAKIVGRVPALDRLDAHAGGRLVRPLVEQCLEFDPRRRPSAEALVAQFEQWLMQGSLDHAATLTRLGTPTPWPISSAPSVPVMARGRTKGWFAGAVLGVATLALVAAVQKTYAYVNAPHIVEMRVAEPSANAAMLEVQDVPPLPIRSREPSAPVAAEAVEELAPDAEPTAPAEDDALNTRLDDEPARTVTHRARRHRAAKKPKEVERTTGRVAIEAWTTAGEPVLAHVWIGGQKLPGRTPMTVDFPPGDYKLHLESETHPAYDESISVEADSTTKLYAVVDLEP